FLAEEGWRDSRKADAPGWSVWPKHFADLTTPSAPAAHPPLLCERGMPIPGLINELSRSDLADSTLSGCRVRHQRSIRQAHVEDKGGSHCLYAGFHFVRFLGRRCLPTSSNRFRASVAYGHVVRMG